MRNIQKFMRKYSLTLLGVFALGLGTVLVAPLKLIIFYQPECPKELIK